jgi:4'-phosphopantetheinyl transferase
VPSDAGLSDAVPSDAGLSDAGPADLVPPLRAGECHLWWADPDRVPGRFQDLLDPGERIRYARYRRVGDRHRFLAGRALLRQVAAGYLRIPPRAVAVAARCNDCAEPHGRPTLPGSGIEVSIAHSRNCVLVGATRTGHIGVDVEFIDRCMRIDELLAYVLAPEERDGASVNAPLDFYRVWTRKEAVLKATGDGLRVPMSDVVVSPPLEAARLIRLCQEETRAQDFVLADLEVPDGYAAAVAVLSPGPVEFLALDGGPLLQ